MSHETIVKRIAAMTTKAGVKVTCEQDRRIYPPGIKVSKKKMEEFNLSEGGLPRGVELHHLPEGSEVGGYLVG